MPCVFQSCLLLGLVLDQPGAKVEGLGKDLDPTVIDSWKKADGLVACRYGWFVQDGFGSITGGPRGSGVPGFFWYRPFNAEVVRNLPIPSEPFALILGDFCIRDDAQLKEYARFGTLQVLDLHDSPVTGEGLKHLAGLKKLELLCLARTKANDAGLKSVAKLKALKVLNLDETPVTDAGLRELAGLENLQTLSLIGTNLADPGLKELVQLKSLRVLQLRRTKITDAGLKELAKMKELETLDLCQTKLTDNGLEELTHLKNLRSLNLTATRISDNGLKQLAECKGLRILDIKSTIASRKGVAELRKARPDLKVITN